MEAKLLAVFTAGLTSVNVSRRCAPSWGSRGRPSTSTGAGSRRRVRRGWWNGRGAPRPHPNAISGELEDEIVRLRKTLRVDNGAQMIAYHLARAAAGIRCRRCPRSTGCWSAAGWSRRSRTSDPSPRRRGSCGRGPTTPGRSTPRCGRWPTAARSGSWTCSTTTPVPWSPPGCADGPTGRRGLGRAGRRRRSLGPAGPRDVRQRRLLHQPVLARHAAGRLRTRAAGAGHPPDPVHARPSPDLRQARTLATRPPNGGWPPTTPPTPPTSCNANSTTGVTTTTTTGPTGPCAAPPPPQRWHATDRATPGPPIALLPDATLHTVRRGRLNYRWAVISVGARYTGQQLADHQSRLAHRPSRPRRPGPRRHHRPQPPLVLLRRQAHRPAARTTHHRPLQLNHVSAMSRHTCQRCPETHDTAVIRRWSPLNRLGAARLPGVRGRAARARRAGVRGPRP